MICCDTIAVVASLLQKCIAMCMDRYMDAWNVVSRAYTQRLQRERNKWTRKTLRSM